MFERLRRLAAACVVSLAAGPAFAAAPEPADLSAQDQKLLDRFVAHLNSIETLKARIVQEAAGEPTREGTFYLKRPGKLRVEYKNSDTLLVADGKWLYHYDGEFDSTSHAPLAETLAGVLARGDLALSDDVVVTGFQRNQRLARVTLKRRERPEAGKLTLLFQPQPARLRQWRITDASGQTTQVALYDQRYNLELPAKLFKPPKRGTTRF